VFVENVNEVAPVWSRVFVPESDHVAQLVHNYAKLVAVLAYRYRLRSTAALAHERTTPASIIQSPSFVSQNIAVTLSRPEQSRSRSRSSDQNHAGPSHNAQAEDKRWSNEIMFFEWTYVQNSFAISFAPGTATNGYQLYANNESGSWNIHST